MAITTYPVLTANGYVTVTEAKTYWTDRLKVWAGKTDAQIEAAILAGSSYLDMRFTYNGYRQFAGQILQFPRQSAFDDRNDRVVGIPLAVKNATCEYAFRALSADIFADPARDDTGERVKSKSSKVGPIEEKVEFMETNGGYSMPSYPFADRMLMTSGLVASSAKGGLGNGSTVRA